MSGMKLAVSALWDRIQRRVAVIGAWEGDASGFVWRREKWLKRKSRSRPLLDDGEVVHVTTLSTQALGIGK